MTVTQQAGAQFNDVVVSPRDILFECPACGKSLVVDEAGEGMILECPKCHINVIVPPKQRGAPAPEPAEPVLPTVNPAPLEGPFAPTSTRTATTDGDLTPRLAALGNKMKELQTQRSEINNRMASRINEINRDLVLMARLEAAHAQVVQELNQLMAKATEISGTPSSTPHGPSRVNLRS